MKRRNPPHRFGFMFQVSLRSVSNASVCRVVCALSLVLSPACVAEGKLKMETVEVDAPFEMPAITIPDFSDCPRFSIIDLGARPDDLEATSAAIAGAIGKGHAAKGGVVVIPAGEWPTKAIHFKSHVNLHLEDGATLLFSGNPEHYLPAVKSSWEGMECYNYSPLIYAYECVNIAITGGGTLRAKMDVWHEWEGRPEPHMEALKRLYHMMSKGVPVEERRMTGDDANLRPQFIQFNRCENVLLEGVRIRNSPFWTIHPLLSKNIVIRRIDVHAHGHNNDGVDPEMSQNMLIEDSVFDQGDDAIAVKAGRNHDGWRLNTPSKNIVLRGCTIRNAHQLMAIGSELSGGVENVLVEDCKLEKSVGHLLFIKTNERRGGYVRNIHMRNITAGDIRRGVLGIETDVLYQWRDLVPTIEVRLTPISEVHLADIKAGNVKFVSRIQGQPDMPVRNISMSGISVGEVKDGDYLNQNVEGFSP